MALPQQIVKDVGGTVEVYLPVRPDSATSQTVSVFGNSTSTYVNEQTPTLDSVNTTLSAGSSAGATSVTVASATGITPGTLYLIGNGTSAPKERRRVRAVSGTTITLGSPLRYAQASGAGFVGTKLSYAVTSAQATDLFWNGRAQWTWVEGGVTRKTVTSVECTLRQHRRICTIDDVIRLYPKILTLLDSEIDTEDALDMAYEQVFERMLRGGHPRTTYGDNAFVLPTVYQTIVNALALSGPNYADLRDWYAKELERALANMLEAHPTDANQDGTANEYEKPSYHSIPWGR